MNRIPSAHGRGFLSSTYFESINIRNPSVIHFSILTTLGRKHARQILNVASKYMAFLGCFFGFLTQPRRSPDSQDIQDGPHQVTEHTAMLHSNTSHFSQPPQSIYLNFLKNYAACKHLAMKGDGQLSEMLTVSQSKPPMNCLPLALGCITPHSDMLNSLSIWTSWQFPNGNMSDSISAAGACLS